MSHDSPANLQIFSPTGSGRNSPSPRNARSTTEEALLKKDKGFRRYAAGVERALALWDTAQQEWADYISFLARLLKALQAHPSEIPVVPHSDIVALRLSQCLNPALPSGVHQKALETYGYIFSVIGKESLARDLNIYFPGLASVLSFASLSVRPLFLSVFETYILKLNGDALRPALKAIILSLLPGLEDETSEDFERMVSALDKLRDTVQSQADEIADVKSESGSSHFWQCFFLATITNASRRQGALAFLVRRLPRFRVTSGVLPAEAEAAISPEPGLLIRCFEAGLLDEQLLIQRGFLDMLVSHLPLDSPVLQQRISPGDLERLVAAAASVVSRRDMSLNRRLWAWLLGPEPTSNAEDPEALSSPTQSRNTGVDISAHHAAYFSQHGLQALTRSVMKMIDRPSKVATDRARPFRICLSFMDRLEVGGLIVPEVFLPALQSVQSYSELASKEEVDEVMRSASTFFDGVDSGLIWGKLIHLVTSALDKDITSRQEALRRIKLAKFVLARFNLKEEEMLFQHMPLMILSTLASLNEVFNDATTKAKVDQEVVDIAFEIADSLVQIVPDRALKEDHVHDKPSDSSPNADRETVFKRIRAFYEENQGSLDVVDPPFTGLELGHYTLRESSRMFVASIQQEGHSALFEMPSKVLSNLIFKVGTLDALGDLDLVTMFQDVLASRSRPSFPRLAAIITVLTALQTARPSTPFIPAPRLPDVIHPLVASLWQTLSPQMPKYHVETVRCILQLHAMSAESRMVEAAISAILVEETSTISPDSSFNQADSARRFAILWNHTMHELSLQSEKRGSIPRRGSSIGVPPAPAIVGGFRTVLTRPLLILLDSLAYDGTELHAFTRSWLRDLPTLNRVFEVLSIHLQSLNCLSTKDSLSPANAAKPSRPRPQGDDTKECLYYLNHISQILRHPSHYTWVTLAEEPSPVQEATPTSITLLQEWLVRTCLKILWIDNGRGEKAHLQELYKTSVTIISQLYHSSFAANLRDLELEVPLMARLNTASPSLQTLLLDVILAALKLRATRPHEEVNGDSKHPQQPSHRSRLSMVLDRSSVDVDQEPIPPPPQLVECLKYGFSSPSSRLVLDDWVRFLTEVLPLFSDAIFQNLLPLVECLCKQINKTFHDLKSIFSTGKYGLNVSPEPTLISLINGLEQILAKAHDRLLIQETKSTANKSPEIPQGFFGNMVSGVFSSEANQTRTPTANSRLTVLLCFQDTVRICFAIWTWGGYAPKDGRLDNTSASSFGYTSLRMRNRARRILEHLFAAEALECLETLAVLWTHSTQDDIHATAVMGLLNVLNGSKPKHTIPAIFNAVYSRTNPAALDPHRMSTLTSDLADTELVAFLVDYTKSLEDDAMDEIWSDCQVFLRDVLANPLPHRQILPCLLEFTAVIGQKVDNTNFGEQRRMRKELADIFTRILTAVFTTRSMGFLQEPSQVAASDKVSSTNGGQSQKRAVDVVTILASIVPHLPTILVENDRVLNVVSSISTNVIGPTFRAKAFPENVSTPILDLLYRLARVSQTNKMWKKDIYDAFNDHRFFSTPLSLLKESWLPILAQWSHADKDRLPELLSRLSAPTTAGIMFGVGAASARQEADRKTQLTLRRIALLLLAAPEDTFTPNLPQINEKIVELLTATPASSPSSTTRAEVIILLRALILKTSTVHLAPLWPIINGELTTALSSLLPDATETKDTYTSTGIIQACKLLDELVVLDPDDFQLIQWLFISDTIDAVYKPPTNSTYTSSLTDEISEVLSASETPTYRNVAAPTATTNEGTKRGLFLDPLIAALEKEEHAGVTDMARRELVDRVVRPFLGSLALVKFEATYGGGEADWRQVWDSVVGDARGVD